MSRLLEQKAVVDRQVQIHQYAWSLELSTKSWADESYVRVRAHAFCGMSTGCERVANLKEQLLGIFRRSQCALEKAGRKDRCTNQGLYYAQCPKRGFVASGGCSAIPGLLGFRR